jgi:Tfp pilus assembly protein PilN
MFNLIPHIIKQKILHDYRARRVIVVLVGCMLFILILFIFISPSFGYLFFEEKNVIAEAESIKKSDQFKKADEVLKAIQETNGQLRVVSLEENPSKVTEAIEKIVQTKNAFVRITSIQYRTITATSSMITIEGKADKREALKRFVTDLQNIPVFTDVALPISNFVKDKDIGFTISMKIL